jgi:type I restriction enzyme R subunit
MSPIGSISDSFSEKKTREKYVDAALQRRGWFKKYVKKEIDSYKSDFPNKTYVEYDGLLHRGVDPLIDYVLLDEDNSVLAIIEVQVFSQNDEKGRTKARIYANDITRQTGFKFPIFLTNGRIWRLVNKDGIGRKISG